MYEDVATLLGDPIVSYDEYGNETLDYDKRTVYVKPRSVYASEFYSAAQLGITPSIVLTISNRADYGGQKLVKYKDVVYEVIRADWSNGRDAISLTLAERIGSHGD